MELITLEKVINSKQNNNSNKKFPHNIKQQITTRISITKTSNLNNS